MTEPKKPSYAALKRENERLLALSKELEARMNKAQSVANEYLHEVVGLRIHRDQAIRILNGADE